MMGGLFQDALTVLGRVKRNTLRHAPNIGRHLHRHEFGVGSCHEVGDSADLALSAPVEPLTEAAVRDAVRSDGIHDLQTTESRLPYTGCHNEGTQS